MPLRLHCVAAGGGRGRTITLHPQEALLQQARRFQASAAFGEYRCRRQVAEHRLARLVQLGIRQSRYFGRLKTLFQVLLAATVASLTLVASKLGTMGRPACRATSVVAALRQSARYVTKTIEARLRRLLASLLFPYPSTQTSFLRQGFRPDS